MSRLYHKQGKNVTKLFHIKIKIKNTKVDATFGSSSQDNLIPNNLMAKLGLEFHDNPLPYKLGWVNKYVDIRVTKKCKIKFSINENYINEEEVDVVPFDVCGVVFRNPYMYIRDVIFMR
jgi:hypothetical protein